MKRYLTAITFFAVGLVVFIAIPAIAQNTRVYFSQGGDTLTIANGGTVVFEAGSTITGAGIPSASMTAGLTVTGAAVNLNASSNYAVNIGTVASSSEQMSMIAGKYSRNAARRRSMCRVRSQTML